MYIPIDIIYLGNVWDQLNQLTAPFRNVEPNNDGLLPLPLPTVPGWSPLD